MSDDKLVIFDTTLRDGEQSPGIALTPSEKLLIAQQLEKLKVDVIEAGFAASSPGDWEGVNLIAKNIKNSTIASLARCHPDDIEQAWEAIKIAKDSRIHVFTSTSACWLLYDKVRWLPSLRHEHGVSQVVAALLLSFARRSIPLPSAQ